MPIGFDTGRQSFARPGPDAVQVSPNAQGVSRGAQIVGGESKGGIIAGQESAPVLAPQLGSFFDKVMEPHLKRRQDEEFIRGAVVQMGRQAGDEIKASNGGFSKIFGQSAYVEGAVHYRAQEAVGGWVKEAQDREDDLVRMSDDERARYVRDSIDKLSSGDAYTDQMVRAAVFEQVGPLMQTIAKKRYVWQQNEARSAFSDNVATQAGVYQKHAGDADVLSDPTDDASAAFVQAGNNMRAALIKPYGMSEDTYRESLVGTYLRAAETGNGHVVRLMKEAGFLNVLDDEERARLSDTETRYGRDAANKLILSDPDLQKRIMGLRAEERLARLGRSVPGGPQGHADRWGAISDEIKRRTGFDFDLYDADARADAGMAVLDHVIAGELRLEERRQQIEDREDQQAFQEQQADRQRRIESSAATLAWTGGNVRLALMQGVDEGAVQILANNDWAEGNFSRIATRYREDGYYSKPLRDQLQHRIRLSIGEGQFSEAAKEAHSDWQKLNALSPAAAQAYYGKLYPQMMNFDKLSKSYGPNRAFTLAFGNPQQYSTAAMPARQKAAARKAVDDALSSMSTWMPWGRANLNKSSQEVIRNVIEEDVAVLSQYSDEDAKTLVTRAVANADRFERYGALAWRKNADTASLAQQLGLKQDEADKIVTTVIHQRLKAAGFAAGASGDHYDIDRYIGPDGKPVLNVGATDDDDGRYVRVIIPVGDFTAAADSHVRGQLTRYAPSKPNRTMQRVIQQNATEKEKFGNSDDLLPPVIGAVGTVLRPVAQTVDRIGDMIEANARKRAARKAKRKR